MLKTQLDITGIICSMGCIFNCLFAPVISYSLPSLTQYSESSYLHATFLVLIISVGVAFF